MRRLNWHVRPAGAATAALERAVICARKLPNFCIFPFRTPSNVRPLEWVQRTIEIDLTGREPRVIEFIIPSPCRERDRLAKRKGPQRGPEYVLFEQTDKKVDRYSVAIERRPSLVAEVSQEAHGELPLVGGGDRSRIPGPEIA
jgi:hypothetical protein